MRYFVAVADCLNFTQAAQRLRVAQPALSRQIRDLEDEIGSPLFSRDSRRVSLTDAGRAFLVGAQTVLRAADDALEAARAAASGVCGTLHVGYAPSPTVEILPRLLHAGQNAFPNVRVQLHDLSSGQMIEQLRGGQLDVALMPLPPGGNPPAGIGFQELASYATCVAMRPDHPLAGAATVSLDDLARFGFAAYCEAEYPEYHAWLRRMFGGATGPRIEREHDSAMSLIADLGGSDRVAMVPSSVSFLSGSRLVLREIDPPVAPIIVGAFYPPDQDAQSLARRFVRLLAEPEA